MVSVRKLLEKNRFITCNLCNYKVHIKCNETDVKTYEMMKNNEQTMICIKCKEENIPFFSSSNNEMMKEFNNSQSLTFITVLSHSLKE